MVTIDAEHTHARTGGSVTYQADLNHGPESTYYAARLLLQGATWHELESGTIAGPGQDARTPQVMQAAFAQIDGLDFEALKPRVMVEARRPSSGQKMAGRRGPQAGEPASKFCFSEGGRMVPALILRTSTVLLWSWL